VVLSENVATALYCWVNPRSTVAFRGVTAIEVAVAEVTFNTAVPEIDPDVAVMVALPFAMACANPRVGEVVLTVAMDAFDEVQFAVPVKFCVLPSV